MSTTSANCGPPWSSLSAPPPCSSRASVTHSSSGPHRSQSRSRAELRFGYRTWMNFFPTARRSRRMVSFTGSSSVENSSSLLDGPTGTEMSPSTGMSPEMETSDSPANGLLDSSAAAILLNGEAVFTKTVCCCGSLDDVSRVNLMYYITRQRQKRQLRLSNTELGPVGPVCPTSDEAFRSTSAEHCLLPQDVAHAYPGGAFTYTCQRS